MQAKSICARKWGGERESEITKSEHMYFMDDPLQKYYFRNDQNFSLTIQYHLNQIRIKICVLSFLLIYLTMLSLLNYILKVRFCIYVMKCCFWLNTIFNFLLISVFNFTKQTLNLIDLF